MSIENCPTARLRDLERLFQQRVCRAYARFRAMTENRDEDNARQAALELERNKGIYDTVIAELERRANNV